MREYDYTTTKLHVNEERNARMSLKSRKLHKETFTTVGTGLLINYPLNIFGLYLCITVVGMDNPLHIGTTITAFMTVVAYVRVYTIRRWFHDRG